MRHVKFTMEVNKEYGEEGIVPLIFRNWNSYMPTGDFGIAHDLLEHGTKETGEIWQELRALGALLYVRGFQVFKRDWDKKHYATLAGESFASELTSIYRTADEFDATREVPQIALRKFRGKVEGEFKMLFHSLRNQAKTSWDIENNGDCEEGDEYYEVCPYLKSLDAIEAQIREGYYRARKRYKGEYVGHVREAIMREVQKEWAWLTEHTETGVEFTLSYNLDGHCKITSQQAW